MIVSASVRVGVIRGYSVIRDSHTKMSEGSTALLSSLNRYLTISRLLQVTLAIRLRGFGWSDAVALPFLATAFENDEGGGRESVTTRPVSSRRHSQQPKGRERYGGNWRLRGAAARDRVEDRAVGVELKLTDSNGDMLRVHVEVKFSANGLRQVRVECCADTNDSALGGCAAERGSRRWLRYWHPPVDGFV